MRTLVAVDGSSAAEAVFGAIAPWLRGAGSSAELLTVIDDSEVRSTSSSPVLTVSDAFGPSITRQAEPSSGGWYGPQVREPVETVVEDRTAAERFRDRALVRDGRGDVRFGATPGFNRARERIEPLEATELVGVTQLRRIERTPQHGDRFIVDLERDGEGVTVLAAMRECEARGIVESGRRAVHDFRDERERLQRARPELLEQQEGREVAQVAFVRERQHGAEPLLVDVRRTHIVMRRHDQVANVSQRARRVLTRDGQERILRRTRIAIDEVHDRPGVLANDRGVGSGSEVANGR